MECIVVSYCLSKSACVNQAKYIFHFKGFFAGKKVKQIIIIDKNDEFLIGGEYLLHLKIDIVDKNTLVCRCFRSRSLNAIKADYF